MDEIKPKVITDEDLQRAIWEEVNLILTEQRREIIKRAHERLKEQAKNESKAE